jgi:hypothetical protein
MFREQNPVISGVKVGLDTKTKFPNYPSPVLVKFQTPDHTS